MTYLTTILFYFLSLSPQGGGWKPAKTDDNGNLIILEMEMRNECKNNKQYPTTIAVDSDWSILIEYWQGENETYHIFDNQQNRIYTTSSFKAFLAEIEKIPNGRTIRDIAKCTTPFRLDYPGEKEQALRKLVKSKNCELEDKLMFCYCCAHKMHYNF